MTLYLFYIAGLIGVPKTVADIKKKDMSEIRDERNSLHPLIFKHKELKDSLAAATEIDLKKLVNIINHIHFRGEPLRILLRHRLFEEEIFFDIPFEPCIKETLILKPDKRIFSRSISEEYQFLYLLVPFGKGIIHVPITKAETQSDGIFIPLPAVSYLVDERQYKRSLGHGVKADLWQNGFYAVGTLVDFTSVSFRLRVHAPPPSSFHWFNIAVPSQIRLYTGDDMLYSGNCRALYEKQDGLYREIVFSPADNMIQRFTAKPLRNPRRHNLPILQAVFEHPFTKEIIQHPIQDVSTSGFLLLDQPAEITLFPGMIIPVMAISIAGIVDIHCRAQIIHRSTDTNGARFGIAILDMNLTDYKRLFQILNSPDDTDESMVNKVSLDELWEFFFETDFIYPEKYKLINSFRQEFRNTYKKLYEEAPDIATHFTFQKNGHIYGHISMIRGYEKTWMIHHLAARPVGGRPVGMDVLKHMIYYLNDVNHLPSANMDFIMAYFRPGKKFPERIFGGFFDYHADTRHCSTDLFAYMSYPPKTNHPELPDDWYLKECPAADSFAFEQFNRRHSNGLFPSIVKRQSPVSTLSFIEKFTGAGFVRNWKMYTLYHIDVPKAFFIDEISDIGLNLSNLLNGIKIFVADEDIDPEILLNAIPKLREIKDGEPLSLMIYPAEFAYKNKISPKMKQYVLWILDMKYGNEFINYLGKKFRIRL